MLFLADIVAGVVSAVIGWIPVVGWLVSLVLSLLTLVLMILGIVNAATGKAKELPLIGKIKIIK